MAGNSGQWKKGQSGNPNGRPREATYAEALREELDPKELAKRVREAINTFQVMIGTGKDRRTLEFTSLKEWADLVKWAVGHMDGLQVRLPDDGKGSRILVTFGVGGGNDSD